MNRKHKLAKRLTPTGPTSNRYSWGAKPTKILLDCWKRRIRDLGGATSSPAMHREIASIMSKYQATSAEIKTKIDNMKKKYKIELTKSEKTGLPSTWIYFGQMNDIMKESYSLRQYFDDDLDFSPLEDSESVSDSEYSHKFDKKAIKVEKESISEDIAEVESLRNDAESEESSEEEDISTESTDLLTIAEAKLEVQRQQLSLMKNMADEMSLMHREFLKYYRNS